MAVITILTALWRFFGRMHCPGCPILGFIYLLVGGGGWMIALRPALILSCHSFTRLHSFSMAWMDNDDSLSKQHQSPFVCTHRRLSLSLVRMNGSESVKFNRAERYLSPWLTATTGGYLFHVVHWSSSTSTSTSLVVLVAKKSVSGALWRSAGAYQEYSIAFLSSAFINYIVDRTNAEAHQPLCIVCTSLESRAGRLSGTCSALWPLPLSIVTHT